MKHKYPDDYFGTDYEVLATIPIPKDAIEKIMSLPDTKMPIEYKDTNLLLGYMDDEPCILTDEGLTETPDPEHAAVVYCIDVEPEDAIATLEKYGYLHDGKLLENPVAGITVNMIADGMLGITTDVDWEHVATLRSIEEIEAWAEKRRYPTDHKLNAGAMLSHAMRNPGFKSMMVMTLVELIKKIKKSK